MKNPQPSSPSSPKANNPQAWRPAYWNKEHGTAWSRVREAFSRDWEQTKTDVTGKGPDLQQDVPDTVKQAAGTEPPSCEEAVAQAADGALHRCTRCARLVFSSPCDLRAGPWPWQWE